MKNAYRSTLAVFALASFSVFTLSVQAQFNYVVTNGTVTITGYTGPGGDVNIPETINGLPVTSIGVKAFAGLWSNPNTNVMHITIPQSVTSIGWGAFCNCTRLDGVKIPNSVTNIGESTFASDYALTTIVLPNSITRIEGQTFFETPLRNLRIPDSVTYIGERAFMGCVYLNSITIPHSVSLIGRNAFFFSGLTNITIGNGLVAIGGGAFEECGSLTGLYFSGDAPAPLGDIFGDPSGAYYPTNATAYYLPGTSGWATSFGARPAAPWALPYPVILTTPPRFGIQTNGFGFRMSWATNASVVVESSTVLTDSVWSPVSTNMLVNGWSDFTDAARSNHPVRFYRLRKL